MKRRKSWAGVMDFCGGPAGFFFFYQLIVYGHSIIMKTYACIMAGGSGERFWPLSRIARPKHLVPLLSETTLLDETVRRVEQALPKENVFVLTNAAQIEGCRAVLPQLKAHQF